MLASQLSFREKSQTATAFLFFWPITNMDTRSMPSDHRLL